MDCWLMVDLKYNFECDSLNELSDDKNCPKTNCPITNLPITTWRVN